MKLIFEGDGPRIEVFVYFESDDRGGLEPSLPMMQVESILAIEHQNPLIKVCLLEFFVIFAGKITLVILKVLK